MFNTKTESPGRRYSARTRACHLACLALLTAAAPAFAGSKCYGTTANGKIDGAVQLPSRGANFSAYSDAGVAIGRTYVHQKVSETVVAAYRELEQMSPDSKFVYGETGWKNGGPFKPHRTHQNGLSVDFFVPVRDRRGQSTVLPTNVTNKFGYEIEFDADARFGEYEIDFNALSAHLYVLDQTAKRFDTPIRLVIFEPSYLPRLLKTQHGPYLRANIAFMQKPAWVKHDEHYHVDFAIPCQPMQAAKAHAK
jgi:penicillin-insensitive murein DD-endopeptidase